MEGAIWSGWQTSDDLSFEQAINFLTGVSDSLHEVVESSLESLADATALPVPVNIVGSNVIATMLTKSAAEPIEDLTHGLELLGIFLGLVTGLHPLVMTCAKYLIHDELGNALTHAINSALDSMFRQLGEALGAEVCSARKAADVPEANSIALESIVQDGLSAENIRQRQGQRTEDPTNYLQYFSSIHENDNTVDSRDNLPVVNEIDRGELVEETNIDIRDASSSMLNKGTPGESLEKFVTGQVHSTASLAGAGLIRMGSRSSEVVVASLCGWR
jgi:hypothetical protein